MKNTKKLLKWLNNKKSYQNDNKYYKDSSIKF